MQGFKDMRSTAELLLAPKRPLSRTLAGLSGLKLNLGGSALPGVITDVSQLAGPLRNLLTSAIKNKQAVTALASSISSVLADFDTQLKKLQTGSFVQPDPLFTVAANGIPAATSFLSFSSLQPGKPIPASFNALIQQRKTQLQQLVKSFARQSAEASFTGVLLQENTSPKPYPLVDNLDLPDVPRLAQGGKVAAADSILKDKVRFTVHGVTIGTGKPNFWQRALASVIAAVTPPSLNATVNQVFKDRTNAGTWSEPVTSYAAQFPYNRVQQTESGHVFELDDTPGAERVHIFHRSGSFIEFHPDGSVVYKSMKNGYRVTMADEHVKVAGSCHVAVDGNSTLYVKGNVQMQTDGDFNVQAKGDYNVFASNINLRAKQTFKGDGTQIDLRYITLPFSIMPVSYGLAPIGFAPRVNLTAVATDFPDVNLNVSAPSNDANISAPTIVFAQPPVPEQVHNPLSNWSAYTFQTAAAIAYRVKFFDTPEEVNDIELYNAHTSLQSNLGDTTTDNRRLGGKLRTMDTGLVAPAFKPTINYLSFDDFKGVYAFPNDYKLGGTSFTLADVTDLTLHSDLVSDTSPTTLNDYESTPVEGAAGSDSGSGGTGGDKSSGTPDAPEQQVP